MARYNRETKDDAYKYYMSDSLYASSRGEGLRDRLFDLMNRETDSRTAEQIINDVMEKAGLRIE